MEDFVIFNINEMVLGINMINVQKIIRLPVIAKIPNSLKYIEGVIDFDGNLISVINLKKKFDFSHATINIDSNLLIIINDNGLFGIIVDEINEIVKIDYSKVVKNVDSKYIFGVTKIKNNIISILNFSSLVNG